MIAMTSPTFAISPFFLSTSVTVPAAGAGSSTVAFSLSSVTTGSSFWTDSPLRLSQSPISTSEIDSPTSGTFSSIGILFKSGFDEFCLFDFVGAGRSRCRTGRSRTIDAGELPAEFQAELHEHVTPRPHILRFFLHPGHGCVFRINCERILQCLELEGIKLLNTNDRHVHSFVLFAILIKFVIDFSRAQQDAARARGGRPSMICIGN